MGWLVVLQVVSTLVELVWLGRTRGEKLTQVVLGTKLKAKTGRTIKQMGEVIRIVKPTRLRSAQFLSQINF